jgi:predicted secreted protein
MPEPIKAKDVIIQFLSGIDYVTYGCAAELETTFSMETKSVKTIGDGVWRRKRGQSLGQVINLSGVIVRNPSIPDAFDLLDYFKNMTDVDFKIIFYDEAGIAKILKGYALPTEVTFSAGAEGHSVGSITLEVNGDPDLVAIPPTPGNPDECVAEIATAHVELRPVPGTFLERKWAVIDSMVPGSATITRWDYSISGGGVQTAFTNGSIPAAWALPPAANELGTHSITITPICDNGYSGESFTFSFS